MAHLYILKNSNSKYYIGITEVGVKERLIRHNGGEVKSTLSGKPWHIIHTENFSSMVDARKREKQIKSWKGGNAFRKLVSAQSWEIV